MDDSYPATLVLIIVMGVLCIVGGAFLAISALADPGARDSGLAFGGGAAAFVSGWLFFGFSYGLRRLQLIERHLARAREETSASGLAQAKISSQRLADGAVSEPSLAIGSISEPSLAIGSITPQV
jgi:hypothetical protein